MRFQTRYVAAVLALTGLSFSGIAAADENFGNFAGFVDLYYQPWAELETTLSVDDESVTNTTDGDGYGIKGLLKISDHLALDGEYQTSDYDGSADRDTYRVGGGYYWRYFGVSADYINESIDDGNADTDDTTAEGYGVYVRSSWLAIKGVAFTGAIGYLRLDRGGNEFDGFEYNLGLDVRLNDYLGLFADYRASDLSYDNLDLHLSEARAGLRLVF